MLENLLPVQRATRSIACLSTVQRAGRLRAYAAQRERAYARSAGTQCGK